MNIGFLNKLLAAAMLLLVTAGAEAAEDVAIKVKVFENDALSFVYAGNTAINKVIPYAAVQETPYTKSVSVDARGKTEIIPGIYKTGTEFRMISSRMDDKFITTIVLEQNTLVSLSKVTMVPAGDIEVPHIANFHEVRNFITDPGEIARLEFTNGGKEYRVDFEVRPVADQKEIQNATSI